MDAREAISEILSENVRLRQQFTDIRYLAEAAITQKVPENPTIDWLKANFAETQYRIRQVIEATTGADKKRRTE